MKKQDSQRSFRTQVLVDEQERVTRPGDEPLTSLEEKVVRMVHGFGEPDHKELAFAVGASEDTRMQLALWEAESIADCGGNIPVAAGAEAHQSLLDDIVARYRKD